jgi:hypothetical protein
MCIAIFFKTFVWIISHSKKNRAKYGHKKKYVCIGLNVRYLLFLSHFNQAWAFLTIFEKYSNAKFHENPYNGVRIVTCGRANGLMDRQTWRS